MPFSALSDTQRLERLTPPAGPVRMVLDTDTYNEIDDQFAVVQALLSPEKLHVEALYAAPFHNDRSEGPADGMAKSYDEILRLLSRLDVSPEGFVHRGSTRYVASDLPAEESDAVRDLVARAHEGEDPLYVVAIGAITNVASAILLDPSITAKIVVVWLGGHPEHWPTAREFNLMQDFVGTRIVLDSGVPVVRIPCWGVASHLLTTVPEMDACIAPHGEIGAYLARIFREYTGDPHGWAKEIWDMSAVAWLLNPAWVPTEIGPSPILSPELTWSQDRNRHPIRTAVYAYRNPIFQDLFAKVAAFARK